MSSMTVSPLIVGHSPAIAGRSIPGMVCKLNFAIAISAPVLPADTATSAPPFFTASSASHIEDFQRPCRRAWLGFASILTTTSVCTMREAAFSRWLFSTSGAMTVWSPKKTNSISGWRASAMSAPGTTTAGPKSPPIPSSAIRTFWAIGFGTILMWEMIRCRAQNSGSAVGHKVPNVPQLFLDCAVFLQRGKRCKRVAGGIRGRFWRIEGSARLARIGVDPEHEELGRNEAEIYGIAEERLHLFGRRRADIEFGGLADRLARGGAGAGGRPGGVVHHRLERHHAGLPDRSAHLTAHMQPVAPAPGEIEARHETLDRIDARRFCERGTNGPACVQLDMPARLANVVQPDGGAPGVLRLCHTRLLRDS